MTMTTTIIHPTPPLNWKCPITLVTGLVDLQQREGSTRRDSREYLKLAGILLVDFIPLYVNLVVWIEPHLYSILDEILFNGKNCRKRSNTIIICFTLESLSWHKKYYNKDIPCNYKLYGGSFNNPSVKFTSLYRSVTICKYKMVQDTILMNPFDTSHYAWIDIGVLHIAKQPNPDISSNSNNNNNNNIQDCWWHPHVKLIKNSDSSQSLLSSSSSSSSTDLKSKFEDKVRLCRMRPIFNKTDFIYTTAGGFVSGSSLGWHKFLSIFENLVQKYPDYLEEPIMGMICEYNPELVDTYWGDYKDIIRNCRYPENLDACLIYSKSIRAQTSYDISYNYSLTSFVVPYIRYHAYNWKSIICEEWYFEHFKNCFESKRFMECIYVLQLYLQTSSSWSFQNLLNKQWVIQSCNQIIEHNNTNNSVAPVLLSNLNNSNVAQEIERDDELLHLLLKSKVCCAE